MKKNIGTGALGAMVVLATFLIPNDSHCIMRQKSLFEIARHSETVVEGKVVSIDSKWEDDSKEIITTEVVIDVSNTNKGKSLTGQEITVSIPGGAILEEDKGMTVSDQPEFEVGEEVILFLSRDLRPRANSANGSYFIQFAAQGKMKVRGGKAFKLGEEYSVEDVRDVVRDVIDTEESE